MLVDCCVICVKASAVIVNRYSHHIDRSRRRLVLLAAKSFNYHRSHLLRVSFDSLKKNLSARVELFALGAHFHEKNIVKICFSDWITFLQRRSKLRSTFIHTMQPKREEHAKTSAIRIWRVHSLRWTKWKHLCLEVLSKMVDNRRLQITLDCIKVYARTSSVIREMVISKRFSLCKHAFQQGWLKFHESKQNEKSKVEIVR